MRRPCFYTPFVPLHRWCCACVVARRPHNWEDVGLRTIVAAIEALAAAQPSADASRLVVHGHSRGGHGAWALATRMPDRVLGVASACGWYSREECARRAARCAAAAAGHRPPPTAAAVRCCPPAACRPPPTAATCRRWLSPCASWQRDGASVHVCDLCVACMCHPCPCPCADGDANNVWVHETSLLHADKLLLGVLHASIAENDNALHAPTLRAVPALVRVATQDQAVQPCIDALARTLIRRCRR
jgi:pimeloyl-ACP methyl ester carboxylesterase